MTTRRRCGADGSCRKDTETMPTVSNTYDVLPQLRAAGIHIRHYRKLGPTQQAFVVPYCARAIFPVLTPLALDPTHPFPHIATRSLTLAVVVNDPLRGECLARVQVEDVFPRLIRLPDEDHIC